MKTCLFIPLTLLCCFFLVSEISAQSADDLLIMTEQYPPYNFEAAGKLQGITVDMMVLMLEKLNSQLTREDIRILPWAYAYNKILEKEHTVLFAMARTDAREHLFEWMGPIITDRIGLIARKDAQISIETLDDLTPYNIGVIRDDIGEQLLAEAGVEKKQFERVAKAEILVKLLRAERIDLWAYDENVAKWIIKTQGMNPENFKTVFVLREGQGYYAFHKDTPDALIQQFQQALDELKKVPGDGGKSEYEKVLDRYLK